MLFRWKLILGVLCGGLMKANISYTSVFEDMSRAINQVIEFVQLS